MREKFEIGRILHWKSESGNLKLDLPKATNEMWEMWGQTPNSIGRTLESGQISQFEIGGCSHISPHLRACCSTSGGKIGTGLAPIVVQLSQCLALRHILSGATSPTDWYI